MIHFVLNANCQKLRGFKLKGRARRILRAHFDSTRAFDVVVIARHRKAALFAHELAVSFVDFGVDEHAQVRFVLRNVDDDDAFMYLSLIHI